MQAATPRRRCQDWSSETPAKPGAAHPDPRGAGGPGTLRYRGLRFPDPHEAGGCAPVEWFLGMLGWFFGVLKCLLGVEVVLEGAQVDLGGVGAEVVLGGVEVDWC